MLTKTDIPMTVELGYMIAANSEMTPDIEKELLNDKNRRTDARTVCIEFFKELTNEQRSFFRETASAALSPEALSLRRTTWTYNIRVLGGVHNEAAFGKNEAMRTAFLKPPQDPDRYTDFLKTISELCTPVS